jgi:glycosyltransferase involved in cell wall biosynthesis
MQKSLSIVIPAYNEERHLVACLDAIAVQTVKPDEVIVVDNNSTDRTADIARKYSFVKLFSENRQGIIFARNRGFDETKSDIIARIDADTVLPTFWVERVKAFYADTKHQQVAITGSCYFYNLHSGRLTGRMYDLIVFRLNRLLLGYYFPWGSNSALPKAVWQKVRGQIGERTDIHEDLDLGFHLHQSGYETKYLSYLRVGAIARRIITDRGELWTWLAMWPRTFKANGSHNGWLAWPFAVMVWCGRYGIFVTEKLADLFS